MIEKHNGCGLVTQLSQKNGILSERLFIHYQANAMNPQTILALIHQHLLRSSSAGSLVRVILYGSRLRGNTDADTDVDLLCIVKPHSDWKERRSLRNALGELELRYDLLFDVRFLSTDDLMTIQAKQPFVRSALEEGMSATLGETIPTTLNDMISV